MPSNRRLRRSGKPDAGLTLDQLNQLLDSYSERISTQLRTVTLGVLGTTWLLLLKADEVSTIAAKIDQRYLLAIAIASIASLLLDLLQYLLAEHAVEDTFDRAAHAQSRTAAFREDSFAYRAQIWCYRLKLVVALGTAGFLVIIIGCTLLA